MVFVLVGDLKFSSDIFWAMVYVFAVASFWLVGWLVVLLYIDP